MELTLYHGDNGEQEFWATRSGGGIQIDLFRNHSENRWYAVKDGALVEDAPASARHCSKAKQRPGTIWVPLSAKTAEGLARRFRTVAKLKLTLNAAEPFKK